MGGFIIRMERDGDVRYAEWSTIIDAPVTYLLTRAMFEESYREEYGAKGMERFHNSLERADVHGTSCFPVPRSLADVIRGNHAGDNGAGLTEDQIWQQYLYKEDK